MACHQCEDADLAAMRDEVEKLRAEVEQLRRERDEQIAEAACWRATARDKGYSAREVGKERDEARAEVERLRAEVDSTKAALIDAALIQERDELKARLAHAEADAEQAIHNEAFMERQRIAEWLRTASRARGVLISIHSSQDIARCADAIEAGEHEG